MRRLMWFTIGFALACAVGAWLFRGIGLGICMVLMVTAAAVCLRLRRRDERFRIPAAVALGCSAGLLWFGCFSAFRLAPALALDGKTCPVEAEISSYSWETEYGTACTAEAEVEGRTYRMQLYLNESLELYPGDRLSAQFRLRTTDRGGRKDPTYHRGNGIFLLAYQKEDATVIPGEPGLRHLPTVLRQNWISTINAVFPADTAGFARALVLGDKSDLSYQTRTDFKITGISHMVAVSGLHLSVLFAIVYVLARKGRFLTAILGIPCALLFAAAVGFTPSVTRAAIMLGLFMLSLTVNREYDPPTALAFAALSMLIANPLVITSVGFEMSVGSVAGIFLFYRTIRGWFEPDPTGPKRKKRSPLLRAAASSAAMTLSATALTAPLAAGYFGTFSLIGVLSNLLTLPVIGGIFCGVLLTCALGWIPAAASVLGWVVSWPIRYLLWVSHLLAGFPLAAVYTASPYLAIWIGFACLLVIPMVFGGRKGALGGAAAAAAGLALALCCAWAEPMSSCYRVSVLDVGQGQCVLLQSRGNAFLVDCGGDHDERAADRAAETLLSMGIRRLDGLIISHYDRDHCGGAPFLASRIPVDRAFLPVPQEPTELSDRVIRGLADSEIVWMDSDLEITFRDCRIRIFAPQNGKTDNESCAAVLFQRGKCDTLIPGDLPASRERMLLELDELPDLEVLVVGHHGSASSTCQELLDALAPDAAIISVGKNNSYGHPAREVLERLESAGCRIFRTDQMGTITYRR